MCADSTTPSYWPSGWGGAGNEGPAVQFLLSPLAAAQVEAWLGGFYCRWHSFESHSLQAHEQNQDGAARQAGGAPG